MCPRLRFSGRVFAGALGVCRGLRFQLIAIVVVTVATVLAASQWLDTRLSEQALEEGLRDRALHALEAVNADWDGDVSGDSLARVAQYDHAILALDTFRVNGGAMEAASTAGREHGRGAPGLASKEASAILSGRTVSERVPGTDGARVWRLAIPVQRGGRVVGTVSADLSLDEVTTLQRRLRTIDGLFLLASTLSISLVIALFLEQRVTRPVAELVDGMRRAEGGALDARVTVRGGGEFAFLGGCLNRMLARIGELTAGLESRIRQATRDLAERNRELRETNEKLSRAQLEIARSERLAALGQLAGTIAHELGSPLNSVLGYTQLLLREDPRPAQAEKLAIVESQIQRMIETIRSVLGRTRDRGLERRPVVVDALVSEALALVSARVAGRDIGLRKDVPADLPPVSGDAVGLRQVLLNLLANAIDATEPAGTIAVTAAVVTPGSDGARWVEIAVCDTGDGMRAENVQRVFEPFYTTKAPGRGTGLGLAIVDHVVRAHGGRVIDESVVGQGTTMRVRLPLGG